MTDTPQRFYEFDNFLVDSQQRLLYQDGDPLDLTPKVFDILLELVRHSGRVVEKKELMETVWPDSFVEDSNLTQQVSTLRKKLSQRAGAERYILTVPGRGYRFIATVRGWDDDGLMTVHERVRSRVIVGDETKGEEDTSSALERKSGNALADRAPGSETTQGTLTPVPSVIAVRSKRRTLLLSAGALIAVILALGLAWFFGRSSPAPFATAKLAKFTTIGKTVSAAISPDGRYVAYAVADGGRQSLWVRQVATANTGVQIIAPLDTFYLALAYGREGDYLYYLSGPVGSPTSIHRVPALGGTSTKLVEDVDGPPTFSPDGKRMAFMRGYPDLRETAILLANTDGTAERKLASLKGPGKRFVFPGGPAWSPDGEKIACAVQTAVEYQDLFEVKLSDGSMKPITNGKWLRVGGSAWTNDGRGLVMVAADQESGVSQVWHVSYPGGDGRRITNDLNNYRDLTLTADSQKLSVVQSDQQTNVWLAPEAKAQLAVQITSGNYDGFNGLSWTTNGRLVYTAWARGAQNSWIVEQDKTNPRQLTESAGNNHSMVFSPDRRFAVFVSTRDGNQRLWRMEADGTNQQPFTDGIRDGSPVFSPDGQWVIYRSYSHGGPHLYRIPSGGGQPQALTEKISGPPAISPDGKLIACTYREDPLGKHKLALIPIEGGAPVKLFDLQDAPRGLACAWTSDGQALAFIVQREGVANIWLQPIDGGAPKQLTDFKSDLIFGFAFSPDGRQLAITRGRVTNDVVLINDEGGT